MKMLPCLGLIGCLQSGALSNEPVSPVGEVDVEIDGGD